MVSGAERTVSVVRRRVRVTGRGVFKCCDLCWVLILVTEVMELTMMCDAGPSSSDGGRGVVLARKKLI